jgi:hypothetical protein
VAGGPESAPADGRGIERQRGRYRGNEFSLNNVRLRPLVRLKRPKLDVILNYLSNGTPGGWITLHLEGLPCEKLIIFTNGEILNLVFILIHSYLSWLTDPVQTLSIGTIHLQKGSGIIDTIREIARFP